MTKIVWTSKEDQNECLFIIFIRQKAGTTKTIIREIIESSRLEVETDVV